MQSKIKFYSDLKEGVFSAPSFKSDTIRKLLASAFSGKAMTIANVSFSFDELYTIRALDQLGVKLSIDTKKIYIEDAKQLNFDAGYIDCGESATLFRLIFPLLLFKFGEVRLTGMDSLFFRPLSEFREIFPEIKFYLDLKKQKCEAVGTVKNQIIEVGTTISSQYLSGLLMACALVDNGNKIKTDFDFSKPSFVSLTLDILKEFGYYLDQDNENNYYFKYSKPLNTATENFVRRDYTNLLALLALAKGLKYKVDFQNLSLDDKYNFEIFQQLRKIGYTPLVENDFISIPANPFAIESAEIDFQNSIDNVLSIFALCLTNPATYRFLNISKLKFKESNRLAIILSILKQLKINYTYKSEVLEFSVLSKPDFVTVLLPDALDHRVQMLNFTFKYWAKIKQFQMPNFFSVSKSFPEFVTYFKQSKINTKVLKKLRAQVDEVDRIIEQALVQRAKITQEIAKFKNENAFEMISHARRDEVINGKNSLFARNIFNQLVSFTESNNMLMFNGAALVGKGVADSLSPEIHEETAEVLKLPKYPYDLVECSNPDDFQKIVEDLLLVKGKVFVNITTPYKNQVLSVFSKHAEIVRETQAANTVIYKNEEPYLLNTDFFGIFAFLDKLPEFSDEAKFFILGEGAVARTIECALDYYIERLDLVKPKVYFVSLNPTKKNTISFVDFLKETKQNNEFFVFNATTCSFQTLIDQGSFNLDILENACFVASVNYKLDSLEFKLKYPQVLYGEGMLMYQAFTALYAALTKETGTSALLDALFWYIQNENSRD